MWNVGNPGGLMYFSAKYLENTFRDETMAESLDKNELITKKICQKQVNDENYIYSENSLLLNSFHGLFRGVKLDLAILTYQEYVNMPSHDSGDIKNVENKLITKKIQAFEIRRNM